MSINSFNIILLDLLWLPIKICNCLYNIYCRLWILMNFISHNIKTAFLCYCILLFMIRFIYIIDLSYFLIIYTEYFDVLDEYVFMNNNRNNNMGGYYGGSSSNNPGGNPNPNPRSDHWAVIFGQSQDLESRQEQDSRQEQQALPIENRGNFQASSEYTHDYLAGAPTPYKKSEAIFAKLYDDSFAKVKAEVAGSGYSVEEKNTILMNKIKEEYTKLRADINNLQGNDHEKERDQLFIDSVKGRVAMFKRSKLDKVNWED
jgi:hypothetical protein